MPTVPDNRIPTVAQSAQPMPYQSGSAPALAFGAGGEGLARAGQGLQQFGDALASRAKEMIAQNDRIALEDGLNQYHDQTRPLVTGWKQLQGRDAMSLYDPQNNQISPKVGADLSKIRDQIGQTLPERVRPFFNVRAENRQESILDEVAGHVVAERARSMKEIVDVSKKLLDNDLQDIATQVEGGSLRMDAARDRAGASIADARTRGLIDEAGAATSAKTASDYIDQAATRSGFKGQPDRIAALDALYRGNLPPEVRQAWERQGAQQRDALFSRMAEESGRILAAQNQARDMSERNARLTADKALNQALFDPNVSQEQRVATFQAYSRSAFADAGKLKAVDDLIRGGGRDLGKTDARAALALEGAIRRGDVKTEDDLAGWAGQVSLDDLRSHYVPLLEAKRNERFKQALDWATSEVGGSSQGLFNLPGNDPVATRVSRLEASMLDARKQNPDADPWEEARWLVPTIKGQAGQAASAALPSLVQGYRDAMASGDARKIGAARISLIAVMQQAGMVDALTAAQQGFNPLSVIDKQQAPTNGR